MYNIISGKFVIFVLVVSIVHHSLVFCQAEEYAVVGTDEVDLLLDSFSAASSDNYNAIKTWQGRYDYSATNVYSGENAKSRLDAENIDEEVPQRLGIYKEVTVDFSLDNQSRKLWKYMNETPVKIYKDMENDNICGYGKPTHFTYFLATPSYVIEAMPYVMSCDYTEVKTRLLSKFKGKSSTLVGHRAEQADPRRFFLLAGKPEELFTSVRVAMTGSDRDNVVLEQKKETAEYRITLTVPGNDGEIYKYIYCFSQDSCFNFSKIIYTRTWLGETILLTEHTLEYVELDGIFVPANCRKIKNDKYGKLVSDETYTFTMHKLNAPIDQKVFTYENLGIEDGDYLNDWTGSKCNRYIYKNSDFVALAEN